MRQNDIEKIIAYQKCFIGPLVWKCFTNNFELLLSEKEFPTFCTFFMYINVHGHQIFAKCTLNECTKMELDPPPKRKAYYSTRGGVTRPCARARQAKRVLTQGRRGVQGRPGTNRLK